MEIGSITCKVTPDMTGMHPLIEELTATRGALATAQDEIEKSIATREAIREQRDQLMALIESQPHEVCEDGWYSCSQAVDPFDGHMACIDDNRCGKPCDCGRDALIAKARAIVGGAS